MKTVFFAWLGFLIPLSSSALPIAKVKAGFGIMCVLRTDATVSCFDVFDNNINDQWQVTPPADLRHVTDLAVSQSYICANVNGTSVRCWGASGYAAQPGPITGRIKNIFVTMSNSGTGGCATTDRGVNCWGIARQWLPDSVFSQTDVDEIAFDQRLDMAGAVCVRQGIQIRCGNALVGYGGEIRQDDPRHGLYSTVPNDLRNPREISINVSRICANTDDGIRCWGRNPDLDEGPASNLSGVAKSFWNGWGHCGFDSANKLKCGELNNCGFDGSGRYTCTQPDLGSRAWVEHINTLPNVRQALHIGGRRICAVSDLGIACGGPRPVPDSKIPPEFRR